MTNAPKNNRFPVCGDEFTSFTSVIIIPIINDDPVLIFKDLGAPLYYEVGGPEEKRLGFEEKETINNYTVYWKNCFLNHKLPDVVKDQYGNFFNDLAYSPLHTYLVDLPGECVEVSIALLNSKTKVHESSCLTYTKRVLRKFEFFAEKRGKNKSKTVVDTARDKLVVKYSHELKKQGNFSISRLTLKLETFGYTFYENDPKSQKKFLLSEKQVRRLLNALVPGWDMK
jgi:hypothetical protein